MRSHLRERKEVVCFGFKTSHIDPNLIGILILLIFSNIYDFLSKMQFCQKMNFYPNFDILSIVFFFFFFFFAQSFALELLFVNLETKMCSEHCVPNTVTFEVDFFRCSNFQYLQKKGIFKCS